MSDTIASTAPPHRSWLWAPWDFWVRPVRAEPAALFRILLASVGLASALFSIAPNLELFLGSDGLCQASAEDDWLQRSGYFCLVRGPIGIPPFPKYLSAIGLMSEQQIKEWQASPTAQAWREWCEDPQHVYLMFWVWVASLALVVVGLATRLAVIVAWALSISFLNRVLWLTNGGDALFGTGMFYLLFCRSGAAFSLDNLLWRRFRRKRLLRSGMAPAEADALLDAPRYIPAWPVRLMQIQLVLVYFCTGLSKVGEHVFRGLFSLCNEWSAGRYGNGFSVFWRDLTHEDSHWLNGEAVFWVLNDVSLTRWAYCTFPMPLFVCRLLSWATLLFELGFPVFVVIRPLRPWLLLGGVVFHLGILIHTEVGYFSPMTLAWYPLFLQGDTVLRLVGGRKPTSRSASGGRLPGMRPLAEQAIAPR
jgi:Vitamin K-dependent gamma-carboxylase